MVQQPERDELKEAGIEPGSRLEKLTYNRSAEVVVAHFRRSRVGTLYLRKRSGSRYERIAHLTEHASYEDPVVASWAPVLIVNVREASGESSGIEWYGIARVDLKSGQSARVFCEGDLRLEAPFHRAWVRELHEAWADGSGVVCTMSFLRPPTEAEKERWRSRHGGELAGAGEHWICDLNIDARTYQRLALLEGVHF